MRLFSIIIFTLIYTTIFAQENNLKSNIYVSGAYFGEKIFHPGIELNINRSLALFNNKSDYKNRLDAGIALSTYTHFKNHVGLRLCPKVSFIHTFINGLELGFSMDIGFMRRFYQGQTFKIDAIGNAKQIYFAGQNALTIGGYFIFGKNCYLKNGENIRIYIETGRFRELNYNGSYIKHPVISFGMSKYLISKK
jgi:hypothetical protein